MPWLFAAFTVVWVIFFAYLVNLNKRQKAMAAEIEALSSKLRSTGN